MRGGILVLVIVSSSLLPGIARADVIEIDQRLLDRGGWRVLVANYVPDGSRGTASSKVCAPDCGPVVAAGAVYNAEAGRGRHDV